MSKIKSIAQGLRKDFDGVHVLGDSNVVTVGKHEVFSSGLPKLDKILGNGGFVRGRFIELYGPEASGKTTLMLTTLAKAQRQGATVAVIDAEHALDPIYAAKLGVNLDECLIFQPENGEQGVDFAEAAVLGGIDIIAIDSVAALTPKAEIDGPMTDAAMGAHPRLISKMCRVLTPAVGKRNGLAIFINQIRMKIGVMFGSPEVTTGGNALKFYASYRLDVRRTKGETAQDVKIKAVKNKLSIPHLETECKLYYGKGFSMEEQVLDIAVESGVVMRNGSWYAHGDDKLGLGKEASLEALRADHEWLADIAKEAGIDI